MSANQGDISFGSFNLYNLQLADERWRNKTYTSQQYEEKISWSADKLMAMDADVITFQELWCRNVYVTSLPLENPQKEAAQGLPERLPPDQARSGPPANR